VSISDRSRVFPDGKNPKKDYNGHIQTVKRYFVISYKLMFTCVGCNIFPKGISRRESPAGNLPKGIHGIYRHSGP
jgi:hypothetical protein